MTAAASPEGYARRKMIAIRYLSREEAVATCELVLVDWRPDHRGASHGIVSITAFHRRDGVSGVVHSAHEQEMNLEEVQTRARALAEDLGIAGIYLTDGRTDLHGLSL